MSTWFAIHVKPGTESKAVDLLRPTAVGAGLEELFAPMSVIGQVESGQVVEREIPLIPGCVVAVAPSKWELRRCLRKASGIGALYAGDTSFDAMLEDEVELIDSLTEPGNRVVGMSEGVADRGRVTIERGPLAGCEGMVRRFSHRKSRAIMNTSVAGVPAEAQVGLRVTRKLALESGAMR